MNNPPPKTACPSCGIPLEAGQHIECPKCETPIRGQSLLGLLEVDVVHSGETWESSRQKIEEAVDRSLHWGHAGVKIIHGYGSTSGRSVIAPQAVALMKRLAERTGGTFTKDRQNRGASIIWFNE